MIEELLYGEVVCEVWMDYKDLQYHVRIVHASSSLASLGSPVWSAFCSGLEDKKWTYCPRSPIGMCSAGLLHCLLVMGRVCPVGQQ